MTVRHGCHDVFRATLRIEELVHIESDWTFRVFDDGTLVVDIERPMDWRSRSGPVENSDRYERELAYSYVCYDGVAEPGVVTEQAAGSCVRVYTCTLYLAKCGAEGESWTVAFSGELSPTNGFTGTWEHEARQDYRLWQPRFEDAGSQVVPHATAWSAAVEPVAATLAPLTTGSYVLNGSLMDDENEGFIVPIVVELELHADGSLTGTSTSAWVSTRDDGAIETAVLSGSWTRDIVDMVQRFEFGNAPNEVFALHGNVGAYQITGVWVVEELEALGDWEDSERQRFHLRVTSMRRPWTPQEHTHFPNCFRAAVRMLLLSSRRRALPVPNEIWPHVLAFCDSEWFRQDDA